MKTTLMQHGQKLGKKCFVLLMFLGSMLHARAQNLLANGGFEDENICTEFIKNCAPEAWIVSSLQSQFYFDDALAYEGRHFIGLPSGSNGRYGSRNFVTSQLLCGLRKGARYRLRMYLRPGQERLDSVGFACTNDNPLYRKWGIRDLEPQAYINASLDMESGKEWNEAQIEFTAKGGEAYMTIALFRKQPAGNAWRPRSYVTAFDFYIDLVSLVPLDEKEVCPGAAAEAARLYEEDARHTILERMIYPRQRRPPQQVVLPPTVRIKVDTLVLQDVLFATNSHDLDPKAHRLLDSLILSARESGVDSLVIRGHTDSTGSMEWNDRLSINRAQSVAEYLQSYFPVIRAYGHGSRQPLRDNSTPGGRQRNRRVEIFLFQSDRGED